MTDLVNEIAQLRATQVPELAAKYEAAFGKPPRSRNRNWLWKRLCFRLQEARLGGLSKLAKNKLDELIVDIRLPTGATPARPAPRPDAPMIGTVLVRRWKGTDIRVEVQTDGFAWNGARYKSLSAVAQAITGAHWNGRLFFGLATRRPA